MCLSNIENPAEFMNTISNMDNEDDPIAKAVNATADELREVLVVKHGLFTELHDTLKSIVDSESLPYYQKDRAKLLLGRCKRFL